MCGRECTVYRNVDFGKQDKNVLSLRYSQPMPRLDNK